MPICLNCEIELPQGTIDCPHCGEECEQEVESNDGGILAGAWGEEEELSFSEGEDEAGELPQVAPAEEELPAFEPEPANEMDELPMAAAEPIGAGGDEDAEDEAARKKAERAKRKAEREAKKAAETGGDDGDGGGKVKRRSTTERKKTGGGASKRGKKSEARPATPKKDPTLSQHRKAVLMALFSWFIFVLLYGGAFTKGLIWPSANPGADQANMANVMFAGLGLFAMLFLWAHLKMGRYISITTVVIGLGVEGWFFFRGLENLPGFVGVGLFTLAQLMLLTGSGWLIRSFFGFIFTLAGGALFCLPHVVDVMLRPPEDQVVRVRKLMAREIGLDGTPTSDGGAPAETHEVWPEMIIVADKFDESEAAVQELVGLLGLGFMEDLLTKPKLRERIMAESVIAHLWMVNGGYTPGGDVKVDRNKGVDGMLDLLDIDQATKEKTDAWRAIRDQAIDRMLLYTRRFLEAPPLGSGTVGEEGKYFSAEVRMSLAGWAEEKSWPIVVQKWDSRFIVVDNAWRAATDTLNEASAKKVWIQRDWWSLVKKLAAELEWDESEMSHVVAIARYLAVMDAKIIVTEAEPPADAPPVDDGGEEGSGEEGSGEEGSGEEGSGEEGSGDDGDDGDDGGEEGSGDDGDGGEDG